MPRGMEQFVRRETHRDFPMALEVVINNDVADPGDELGVVEVGANQLFHTSVRWSPRVSGTGEVIYPSRGNRGVLLITDENEPWLVDWTPYA